MQQVFLVEHEGNKWKVEVATYTTPFSEFLDIIKSKCEIKNDSIDVEFYDKDFEEWVKLDASQYSKLPDKSKLRINPKKGIIEEIIKAPTKAPTESIEKYDIFVSHKQTTGKYLAQSLKHEISQHFPVPLSWWIDVDNLENLQDLTEVVRQSRNFLLLITPDVFDSAWCLQEMRAALKYHKNIILVLDEGVAFPKVHELPEDIHEMFKGSIAIPYFNQKQHREVSIRDIVDKIKTRILMSHENIAHEGAELAHGRPVLCSGIFGNPIQFKAENIVDGNENTRWSGSPGGTLCWIYIDLGAKYKFTGIDIKFEGAYGKQFLLEVEDEDNQDKELKWKPFAECRGQEGWNHYDLRDCSIPQVGRYLRIHLIEGREPKWACSIWLVKLYGKPI